MKKVWTLSVLVLALCLVLTGCSNAATTTTATTTAPETTTTAAAADNETETTTANEDQHELVEDAITAFRAQLEELKSQYGVVEGNTFTYPTTLGASVEQVENAPHGLNDEKGQGVVGAWFADLDKDGTDEMLVAMLERVKAENEDPDDLNVLTVQAYAYVAGSVTMIGGDEMCQSTLNGAHTEDVRLFLQENNGKTELVLYSFSSVVDPNDEYVNVFTYADGEIKRETTLYGFGGWEQSVSVNGEYIFRDGDEPMDTKNYGDAEKAWKGECALWGVDLETMKGADLLVKIQVSCVFSDDYPATATLQVKQGIQ